MGGVWKAFFLTSSSLKQLYFSPPPPIPTLPQLWVQFRPFQFTRSIEISFRGLFSVPQRDDNRLLCGCVCGEMMFLNPCVLYFCSGAWLISDNGCLFLFFGTLFLMNKIVFNDVMNHTCVLLGVFPDSARFRSLSVNIIIIGVSWHWTLWDALTEAHPRFEAGCVCVFALTLKMFRKCCWFKLAVWVLCPPHPPPPARRPPTEATLHDPRPLNCSRELTSATPWESISIICLGLCLMGASSDWAEQNGGIQKPDPFYWVQLLTTVIP